MRASFGRWRGNAPAEPGRTFNGAAEPASQSDPGVAWNPRLLPQQYREHARQSHPNEGGTPTERIGKGGCTMMDVLHRCVSGLDVHKKTVVACVRRLEDGVRVSKAVRTFGTTTRELEALASWLTAEGVTHVAMESTGVYWKPIYNILEGRFEVLLVNAQHLKKVPGRKTDVGDCEWIAQCLQCGLLRPSFVPPRAQREMRDLTRHRAKLIQQQVSVANRIQKVLEDANVKLASVASDVLGVSGRDMLAALVGGESDPEVLAALARGRLRAKLPELEQALHGRVTEHHRFMLKTLLEQLEFLERAIAEVSTRIEALKDPFFREAEARLDQIPGIDQRSAENILAEIGTDVARQFPTAPQLASWTGICPGNNESAGKRKTAHVPKGNRWLKRSITQAAWAASHKRGTYFQARYRRLAPRRGKQRAIVAIAHSMIVAIHAVLTQNASFVELGPLHYDQRRAQSLVRHHVRRLEALGHRVTLEPTKDAA